MAQNSGTRFVGIKKKSFSLQVEEANLGAGYCNVKTGVPSKVYTKHKNEDKDLS
jgi:hypothetical protein